MLMDQLWIAAKHPPSACPERALGILTLPSHFRHGKARCRTTRGYRGNYWCLGQAIEEQLRSPTYLSAPQKQNGHWALGTCQWQRYGDLFIPLYKSSHMALQSSYCDVFLILVTLNDSYQFVYFIKYEQHTTPESDLIWKSSKKTENFCFKWKCHRYFDAKQRIVNWPPADGSRLHFKNVQKSFSTMTVWAV